MKIYMMTAAAAGFAVVSCGAAFANDTVTATPLITSFENGMQTLSEAGYRGLRPIASRMNHFTGFDADGSEVIVTVNPTSGEIENSWYIHGVDE